MNHDKRTRKSKKNLYYGKYFWILFKQVYCISSNEAAMSLDEKPEFILWLALSQHKQDEFDTLDVFGSAQLYWKRFLKFYFGSSKIKHLIPTSM